MPDPVTPLTELAEDVVVVCAVAAGEAALLELADDEVDVDVCADELPAPESPAAEFASVDVEVEAWAVGDDEAGEVDSTGPAARYPPSSWRSWRYWFARSNYLIPPGFPSKWSYLSGRWSCLLPPGYRSTLSCPPGRSSRPHRPGFPSKLSCSPARAARLSKSSERTSFPPDWMSRPRASWSRMCCWSATSRSRRWTSWQV